MYKQQNSKNLKTLCCEKHNPLSILFVLYALNGMQELHMQQPYTILHIIYTHGRAQGYILLL